ncbi:MAG: hypothetical protein ABI361_01470 [Nitrososphaera sp.]
MEDKKNVLEQGIGSVGKLKILRALAEDRKLATIYSLHKKTRLKRDDIKSNLDDLIEIGWVKQNKLANVVYGLNRDDLTLQLVLQLFSQAGYLDQP